MSLRKRSALYGFILWASVLFVMYMFYSPDNYRSFFSTDEMNKLIGSIIVAILFIIDVYAKLTYLKKNADQRGIVIFRHHVIITAILTTLYVAMFALAVIDLNKPEPISSQWFWGLGFSIFTIIYTCGNLAFYIMNVSGAGEDN